MIDYIIVFTRNIDKWGAERSTISLSKYLQDRGFNVIVIMHQKGPITDLLDEAGIRYLVHPFSGWIYQGKRHPRKRHLLRIFVEEILSLVSLTVKLRTRGIKPIAVYSNTLTYGFGAMFAFMLKIVHVQHIRENLDAFDYHLMFGYRRSLGFINKVSSTIICTCNSIRQRYLDVFLPSKVHTIYNGVPPIDSLPPKKFTGKLQIVQVARFMEDKRVMDTLEAFKALKEGGYNDIHLDIYGKGEDEPKIKAFISDNHLQQMITLKGFVSKIDFSPYHVGLMTSLCEAFARSVLDYMNNGLAVIASNTGGNIEQVVDGQTGLLYDVKDPQMLAKAIVRVYDDRKFLQKLAVGSRKRFLANFTQEKYVSNAGKLIIDQIR